ncbi:MAG: extracellular solute-binding protein [Actinomycetia bacterium]|nr:extracellular solute-binding protein [Actinomycetes bacterium]
MINSPRRPIRDLPTRGKLFALVAMLVLALGVTLAACGGDDEEAVPPAPPPAQPEPPPPAPAPPEPPPPAPPPPPAAPDLGFDPNQPVQAQVEGATPRERVINGLIALNAEGVEFPEELTIYTEDLWAQGVASIEEEWLADLQAAGLPPIALNVLEGPAGAYTDEIIADAATGAGAYDISPAYPPLMPDLHDAGYVADLTEYVLKYDPDLEDFVAPVNDLWSSYNGRVYGLPTDGDTWLFYYRKDWLNHPDEQALFQERYGRELRVPATWQEHWEVIEHFTRDPGDMLAGEVVDEFVAGSCEWRTAPPDLAPWWFFMRLWSYGGRYFDDNMNASINSPAGVHALEDLIRQMDWMHPDAVTYDYVECVDHQANGNVFSNISWPGAGKQSQDPATSETIGLWGYSVVPGPTSSTASGSMMFVSKQSGVNPEIAYLFTQWFMDPSIIGPIYHQNFNYDTIRASLFEDPAFQEGFPVANSREYLLAQKANLAQGIPEPLMPGYSEYRLNLNTEMVEAYVGSKSAQDALDAAAEQWDRTTQAVGIDSQKAVWDNLLARWERALPTGVADPDPGITDYQTPARNFGG